MPVRTIDAPKPKSFGGSRNAREIDNFLWGLEQYFEAMGIMEESTKIRTAALYLTDTAMLWWRRRRGDIEKGTCSIENFSDFIKELKRQFYPEDAEDEAWSRLRNLKHRGPIRDYVKEFTTLILEIPDLSEKDSLRYFKDGLQPWAKTELKRRGVHDLSSAIAVAESFTDYTSQKEVGTKPKERKEYPNKSGGEKFPHTETQRATNPPKPKEKFKPREGAQKVTRPHNNCFLCDGPHWARDCPQAKALSAIFGSQQNSTEEENKGAHMGSIQLLNAIHSTPKVQARGLLFVDIALQDKPTLAMLDTGATHNFIAIEEAKRLGLKGDNGGGSIKTVNSPAKPIFGIARGVETHVGT